MKKVKWVASVKRTLAATGLLILAFALYIGLLHLAFFESDSSSGSGESDEELTSAASTDCNDDKNCRNENDDSSKQDLNDRKRESMDDSKKKDERQGNSGTDNTGKKPAGIAKNSKCSNIENLCLD